jgi:hypothetical protein
LQCTRSVRSHAKSLGDTQRSWKVGLVGCGKRRCILIWNVVVVWGMWPVVGDRRGLGVGQYQAAATRISLKKSIFASRCENRTIRTKIKFMSISGIISFVELASVSTGSTYSACT